MKSSMKLLKDLLVDSSHGNYAEIISVITKFLKKTEAEVILQKVACNKYNIIAIFGSPKLLINCHMDTVTGNWQDAHKLKKKNGKAYGLGTCDTKGNIYAVLMAVKKVKPKNLMLLFSVDEEMDSSAGVKLFLKSMYCKGIKNAVICEPTCLKLITKHNGFYSFCIETNAVAGHSSKKGENAIIKMAKILNALQNAFKDDLFNAGTISGGTMTNIIADKCSASFSVRTFKQFNTVLKLVKDKIVKDKANINSFYSGIPFSNNSPFIKVEDGFENVFENAFNIVTFWTEAALFQQSGINSVVFGAGDIQQAHSPGEYVKILQLKKAQSVFEMLIKKEG